MEIRGTTAELSRESTRKKRNGRAFLFFFLLWTVLIAGGVAGAKAYSDEIERRVTTELELQTSARIAAMQGEYNGRLTRLEQNYTEQLQELNGKIEALNELLTFTKDNADSKTDNSNKLYSQLAEVRKQLEELKKQLDVLK